MPTVTYKNTEYVIPEIPLAPSYVVARAGPIFVARNGRTGLYQFVDEDLYRVLIQCKEELKKTEGGMIVLKAGEYVLSKTFPDEDVRDKVFVTGEGRGTVVKAPSGVSPFNPNWVRLDNLVWYDEAGKEHDETLVVVTEVSDGAITNEKIADGTIDLTKKGTYVPVNKAGDTMEGKLRFWQPNELIFGDLKNKDIYVFGSEGGILRIRPAGAGAYGCFCVQDSAGRGIEYSIGWYSLFSLLDGEVSLGMSFNRWKNIYTNLLNLKSYTSDPSLEAGLLWFRSDLGRLRFSPDGSAIKEFVHRDGDTMTGNLLLPDGSVSAPALAFSEESNTGLYRIAGAVRFALGGEDKLEIAPYDTTVMTNLWVRGNLFPEPSGSRYLGSPYYKWYEVYALTVVTGDLGFSENACPLCGKEFQVGDEVVLKVVSKEGGIKTRPCHKSCPSQ